MFMSTQGGEGSEMHIDTEEVEGAIPELEELRSNEDIQEIIEALGYDALDDSTPDNLHERKQVMSGEKLYRNFRAMGKRGELFVLRGDDGQPFGLIGLRADTKKKMGRITLLRTATREKAQFGITRKLLRAAEEYLKKSPRGYTRGVIESPNPSEHLEKAARVGKHAISWDFVEPEPAAASDNESNPLEQAA